MLQCRFGDSGESGKSLSRSRGDPIVVLLDYVITATAVSELACRDDVIHYSDCHSPLVSMNDSAYAVTHYGEFSTTMPELYHGYTLLVLSS